MVHFLSGVSRWSPSDSSGALHFASSISTKCDPLKPPSTFTVSYRQRPLILLSPLLISPKGTLTSQVSSQFKTFPHTSVPPLPVLHTDFHPWDLENIPDNPIFLRLFLLTHNLSLYSTHPTPGVLQSPFTSSPPRKSSLCFFQGLNCQLTLHWFPQLGRFLAVSKSHYYFTQHIFFTDTKIILNNNNNNRNLRSCQLNNLKIKLVPRSP